MKRIICILLSVCMLLSLAACRDAAPEQTEPSTEPSSIQLTEPPTEPASTQQTEAEPVPTEPENGVRTLEMEKILYTYPYPAEDGSMPLWTEHTVVALSRAEAEQYPELAQALEQMGAMQMRTMDNEFLDLVSVLEETEAWKQEDFEPWVSALDVQIRRADTTVVSLLADTWSDYGGIRDFRGLQGMNYDTETGREIMINEVVDVNNYLALAVQEELTGHMWAGELHYEYVVEDYFAETPWHGFNWTLDYNGVTFYFEPGQFCDEGAMTATVTFAEHPELFTGKYMDVPAEYTVELPQHISFFADLNGDGGPEALSVSGWFDESQGTYLDYSICTDVDANCYYEECRTTRMRVWYAREPERNFLYVLAGEPEEPGALTVLTLNEDGSITKSGEKNLDRVPGCITRPVA